MHNALDLASMLLLGVARMFGGTYLALAGIGVCLWAIHLVMVQPPAAARRDRLVGADRRRW